MTRRIAIIRLSALGDIIHTLPSIILIKNHIPAIEITWFVEKGNEKLLECFKPFVNIEVVSLRNKKLKDVFNEVLRIRKNFKNTFDLVIDFQGLLKSAVLSLLLAKNRVGFHKLNLKEKAASFFYKHNPILIDEKEHVIFKNIKLSKYVLEEFFDIKVASEEISYPLLKEFKSTKVIDFLKQHSLKKDEFILINVGGGWETKTLSLEQYEKVINILKNEFRIVILWGNEKERILANELTKITASIKTDFLRFNELFKIIEFAKFIITSDTLALHIADIVKTRSIGIFGPTHPERNGSLNPLSTVVYKNHSCSPCYKKKCKNLKCINQIIEKDIYDKI